VGLVPRQYSTGGRTVLGRISKRGSRYLRMLFVQAAKIMKMREEIKKKTIKKRRLQHQSAAA